MISTWAQRRPRKIASDDSISPGRKERHVDLVIAKQAVYNIQIDARCTYSYIPRDVESYKLLFISCNISTVLATASLVCISVERNTASPLLPSSLITAVFRYNKDGRGGNIFFENTVRKRAHLRS